MAEQRPPAQLYTVIVVSDHSQAVRRFRLARRWVERGAWIGGGVVLVGLVTVVHYFSLLGTASENRVLKEENAQLRSQILIVQEKVAHISQSLDRVERFDAKIRTATQLPDPQRNLAVGPIAAAGEAPAPASEGGAASGESAGDPGLALAASPSLWPSRGWLTSEFGVRLDPASGEKGMHRGLDIATFFGAAVVAPSDGTVVFAGVEGSQGKVLVLDHGFGIQSRYGHLSEILVAPGERVKRGTRVAAVGNTGRSTGPHLHYEVRVNGIPEDPRRFLSE